MNLFGDSEDALPQTPQNYTVLARKYRPADLDGLIGQEALVRTLRNAISTGRLAHAFLLTGIRGVGKVHHGLLARIVGNQGQRLLFQRKQGFGLRGRLGR